MKKKLASLLNKSHFQAVANPSQMEMAAFPIIDLHFQMVMESDLGRLAAASVHIGPVASADTDGSVVMFRELAGDVRITTVNDLLRFERPDVE